MVWGIFPTVYVFELMTFVFSPRERCTLLTNYELTDISANVSEDEVVLTFHLAGQFSYHLTNNFLPAFLILLISYMTLFIPLSDFNERVMVSLTSLLVLAALYSSANSGIVSTTYMKLFDLWFVVLIALSFVVVVFHAVVNHAHHRPPTPITSVSPVAEKIRPYTVIPQAAKPRMMEAHTINKIGIMVLSVTLILFLVIYMILVAA